MGGLGSNPKEYRRFEQNLVFFFFSLADCSATYLYI